MITLIAVLLTGAGFELMAWHEPKTFWHTPPVFIQHCGKLGRACLLAALGLGLWAWLA